MRGWNEQAVWEQVAVTSPRLSVKQGGGGRRHRHRITHGKGRSPWQRPRSGRSQADRSATGRSLFLPPTQYRTVAGGGRGDA